MGKLVKDITPDERERRRSYSAAYRAAHSDEIRANKAAYRAAHRDEIREYSAARISDERTRRTNARMARLGFAFADHDAIVAAIGNAVNNKQKTNKKRNVSA